MPTDFRLPELGENITEADVVRVLVREGDTIAVDQPIATIETEKATVDVPSGVTGRITQIHIAAGQTVSPGAVIVTVDAAIGAEAAVSKLPAAPAAAVTATPPPLASPPAPAAEPSPPLAAPTPAPAAKPEPTEAVTVPASTPPAPAPATPAPPEGTAAAFAAPSVRTFSREIGVDIHAVQGSGPGGRIDIEDVKRHARELRATPVAGGIPPLPDFSQFGEVERQPLSRFRRTIARSTATTWSQIPLVTLFSTADSSAFEAIRRRYRDAASRAGGTLTDGVLLMKLVGAALKEFPQFNATLDLQREELILKQYVHIGLAVDTDRGLVVPVLRDVDKKTIVDLAADFRGISDRVKANALTLEEMRGASFTISSLETLGVSHFTPLVNWPEVAILGVGSNADLPSYEREELRVHKRIALSLSFDHRVIDGADGARFLRWLVNAIHEPAMLDIPEAAS